MRVKVTLANGVTFEGEKDDIKQILEGTGTMRKDTRYYYSKSRGLLPIKEMHTSHLMNAALKMYREWVAELSNEEDPKTLYKMILRGPDNPAWSDLVIEMAKREKPVSTK